MKEMRKKIKIILIITISLVELILVQDMCLTTTYYFDAINGDDVIGNG